MKNDKTTPDAAIFCAGIGVDPIKLPNGGVGVSFNFTGYVRQTTTKKLSVVISAENLCSFAKLVNDCADAYTSSMPTTYESDED